MRANPNISTRPLSPQVRAQRAAEQIAEMEREAKEAEAAKQPPTPPAPAYFVGLDLGQSQDFTAMSVLERTSAPPATNQPAVPSRPPACFAVRHLERFKLGTSYPAIITRVGELFAKAPLIGSHLIVDATGVGRAVVDQIRGAKLPALLVPVTITAGHHVTQAEGGGRHVPKRDLVGVLQVLLQARRLKIAEALPDAKVLFNELLNFRVKVTAAANESFEAWRERDHDDLVLSVAIAAWFAERGRRQVQVW